MANYENIKDAISIHAPAGGASRCNSRCLSRQKFQFTPLREGLPQGRVMYVNLELISIHAPAGGASCARIRTLSPFLFQFTPLREGLHPDG